MVNKTKKNKNKITSSVAKTDDGTVQITYTIPFSIIKSSRDETAVEIGKDTEVPGFRKGKAPLDKLTEHLSEKVLLEKTLNKILPKIFSDSIKEHKIKPSVYPKFDLVKAKDGEDWQIRAQTAEIPEIELGDYEKEIVGASRAKGLWTPGKDKDEKKEPTQAEKEQEVINTMLKTVKVKIPKILIEEEVNSRLSKLLERIEKLGLTLDSYLASIGKTADILRTEYEQQSRDSIAIDLILNKVAEQEKITIGEKEVDAAIKTYSNDENLQKELKSGQQRSLIESILRKRAALAKLTSLIAT